MISLTETSEQAAIVLSAVIDVLNGDPYDREIHGSDGKTRSAIANVFFERTKFVKLCKEELAK